ncbi:MAG: [Fe-Fe] hydrogenase large subunit C-terminal domain-containing protein [Candidatus Lernaella stagnicola]|nr:[Fe-Fe] hydrogenase large subunit C-terminal domain-containing protein [Candidatus Lernaella stagnicola]
MHQDVPIPLVTTIRERCRRCYTCVRECPAKAICVSDGQAEVIPDRCIGCGNCVRVCSQQAKRMLRSTNRVNNLLSRNEPVVAIIAPSFPVDFSHIEYERFVGMVRALGFTYVNEVAFGADLVADRYSKLLDERPDERFIAINCPAVLSFVEKYYPGSIGNLAPIVSPMVATARVVRRLYGEKLSVVFIGPCLAKKAEAWGDYSPGEVDAVLTFGELVEMFEEHGIEPEGVEPSDFDAPRGGVGMLFPISRGFLQAAEISEDLLTGEIVAVDGRRDFVEAIREFDSGDLDVRLLEVLACNGCIMGPGTVTDAPLFRRRARVSRYARAKLERTDMEEWKADMETFADLSLRREFTQFFRSYNLYSMFYSPAFSDRDLRGQFSVDDQASPMPSTDEISKILASMGKFEPEDELNCGACGYDTCRQHAIAIHKGLAESEMCLPYTIEQLRKTIKELDDSHEQLADTQQMLIQSEKLASMGQLAAGVAHEVNNPLGVVLMYAHILLEECSQESKLYSDLSLIVEQADRCKKIVANLLDFARQNRVVLLPTDLNALIEASLKTLRPPENVRIELRKDLSDPEVELDKDQISQVVTNLVSNAFAAMDANGGSLVVRTWGDDSRVLISVSDTGMGIPKGSLHKIFEPFYTTKKMGKGTGLGLAVTYGIVKMHRGDIRVESNNDREAGPTGTTITVTLPRQPTAA